MQTFKSVEHEALDAATRGMLEYDFKRRFTDQRFEGMVSKGFIQTNQNGLVIIQLKGVRRLMDIEGLPYD